MSLTRTISLVIIFGVVLTACQEKKIDKATAVASAKEAYLYGLPIVLTDLTRIGGGRPSNQFHHSHAFPDHTFKLVVRPNNDTYYSSAFLDLGTEPIVLELPDTKGRYAVVPLMDAWTNVFASFGKRNTGTQAQRYVITGPTWKGTFPASITEVKSPTDLIWIIGRIQVNNPEDGKNFVAPIQEQLKLTPLSALKDTSKTGVDSSAQWEYSIEDAAAVQSLKKKEISVVEALKKLSAEEYFNYINELLVNNPPLPADSAIIKRLAAIGITPGKKFDFKIFDEDTQQQLKQVPTEVLGALDSARTVITNRQDGKPDLSIGHYGTDYKKRAAVAYFGLGALGPEEAVYQGYRTDSDNLPLNGDNTYVLHFEKGQLPPARAFWSITLYNQAGYLTENAIRRYAIGDRNKLKFNTDGSLDIYVQHDTPGKEKENNWLPAPREVFNLSVRIYWPTEEFLQQGNWTKPPLKKTNP